MAAAQLFDGLKSTEGLQKKTVPMHHLQSACANGMLWVAVCAAQTIVGFLLAEKLDDDLHISEMGVIPAYGRQGIGATFLRTIKQFAHDSGFRKVSLTTFATIPWNAPFYAKNGFRPLMSSEIGESLALLIAHERSLGLQDRMTMGYVVREP